MQKYEYEPQMHIWDRALQIGDVEAIKNLVQVYVRHTMNN
jgi:hypothetical protein